MRLKDFYKTLGVALKATAEEIKKKYRTLAKAHHPDINQGSKQSEEIFKNISEAYETLKDETKRRAYDRQRSRQNQTGSQARPRRGWGSSRPEYEAYDFSGSGSRSREQEPFTRGGFTGFTEDQPADPNIPTRGFDLQFIIDLPLKIVALGGKTNYSFDKYVQCKDCNGTGSTEAGECPVCKGKRLVIAPVTIEVEIPPGLMEDYTLRIENEGGEGRNGGPPGDLLLKIHTLPHPEFKRVKTDIYARVPLPQKLAQEGGTLEVKTLDSVHTVQVEEGTLTGEEHRIAGAGASYPWEKKRGDFVIKFFISDN